MKKNNIEELQKCELQLLKDVAKMCDENNIVYFLESGTLLGAVRHGGFIPWDDDIDIGMDTENYKKFCELAPQKLGEKYFVQNYKTDSKVGIGWTRVRINGTTSMEKALIGYDIHQGVCMDIFEYRGIPHGIKNKIAVKCNEWKHLLLVKHYVEWKKEPFSKKQKLLYIMFGCESIRKIMITILDMISKEKTYDSQYCYSSWYSNFVNSDVIKIPTKYLKRSEMIKMKFEDSMFYVPKEYEKILELQYGDWKKLPPEEERVGHGDIIVDLENDYKIYYI